MVTLAHVLARCDGPTWSNYLGPPWSEELGQLASRKILEIATLVRSIKQRNATLVSWSWSVVGPWPEELGRLSRKNWAILTQKSLATLDCFCWTAFAGRYWPLQSEEFDHLGLMNRATSA
jgi:hypothetical protein